MRFKSIVAGIIQAQLRAGYVTLRGAVRRARMEGWRSAWTFIRVRALNFCVRIENALCSTPKVACPCCGWRGRRFRFLDCGKFIVPQAECPGCAGHERHRMLHLFLERHPNTLGNGVKPRKMLHFAPEMHLRRILDAHDQCRVFSTDYARAMLANVQGGRFVADIHALPLRDGAMNTIFCLHVLEHVRDDRAAIRELHRVLEDAGEAVIMVPFMMHQTETEEYGRPIPDFFDHVRGYSPKDFKFRLAPFSYNEIMPRTFLSQEEASRFQIPDSQAIYVCTKGGLQQS